MYDMKNLKKLKNLEAGAPEAVKAFWAFDKAAMAPGAIPVQVQGTNGVGGSIYNPVPLLHRDSQLARHERQAQPIRRFPRWWWLRRRLRAGAAITHGTHALKG